MITEDLTSAVEANFLKRRFGIDSCSSELDLDIADARSQLADWKSKGGVPACEEKVTTLPDYSSAPGEIVYCEPEQPVEEAPPMR